MLLIAKKKFRYPRGGSDAVEYAPGDTFRALSERDAKTLVLTRVAEEAPRRTSKKAMATKPGQDVPTLAESGEYSRRDMRAED